MQISGFMYLTVYVGLLDSWLMALFRFEMLSQVSKYENYFTQVLISCQLSNLKQHRILEQYIDILLLIYCLFRGLIYLDFNMVVITFTPFLLTGIDHLRRTQIVRGQYSDKSRCIRMKSICLWNVFEVHVKLLKHHVLSCFLIYFKIPRKQIWKTSSGCMNIYQ